MNDVQWVKCQDETYLNLCNLDTVKIVGGTASWKVVASRMVGFDWDPSEETNKPFTTTHTLFEVKFDKSKPKQKDERRRLASSALDMLLSPGTTGCYSTSEALRKASKATNVPYDHMAKADA